MKIGRALSLCTLSLVLFNCVSYPLVVQEKYDLPASHDGFDPKLTFALSSPPNAALLGNDLRDLRKAFAKDSSISEQEKQKIYDVFFKGDFVPLQYFELRLTDLRSSRPSLLGIPYVPLESMFGDVVAVSFEFADADSSSIPFDVQSWTTELIDKEERVDRDNNVVSSRSTTIAYVYRWLIKTGVALSQLESNQYPWTLRITLPTGRQISWKFDATGRQVDASDSEIKMNKQVTLYNLPFSAVGK